MFTLDFDLPDGTTEPFVTTVWDGEAAELYWNDEGKKRTALIWIPETTHSDADLVTVSICGRRHGRNRIEIETVTASHTCVCSTYDQIQAVVDCFLVEHYPDNSRQNAFTHGLQLVHQRAA